MFSSFLISFKCFLLGLGGELGLKPKRSEDKETRVEVAMEEVSKVFFSLILKPIEKIREVDLDFLCLRGEITVGGMVTEGELLVFSERKEELFLLLGSVLS